MGIDTTKLSQEITGKYTVVSNSFACVSKDDVKDRIQVEIGDSKQVDFYPQVKLMRWDNEVNFSARLIPDNLQAPVKGKSKAITPTISTVDDKIIHDNGNVTSHFYELPASEELPEGGYEFEITLKEKPATNVVTFSLQTKGLEFFYQPYLTQEDRDNGAEACNRGEGSYAVYYKNCPMTMDGGNLYRNGKAVHIYRPVLVDSIGNKVDAELNIDEMQSTMTVTIPQGYLDDSVYPITHVAGLTFGWTGTSNTIWGLKDYISVSYDTTSPASDGTISSISIYGQHMGSATNIKLGVYDDTTLIGQTASIAMGSSAGWLSGDASGSVSSAKSYKIGQNVSQGYNGGAKTYYDYSSGHRSVGSSKFDNAWPNPITWTQDVGKYKWATYATYTAGGGASGPANLKSYNTNLTANIKSINTNLIANVKSLNTNV